VKYGAFWGKLVFGEQNVLNLFGGIDKNSLHILSFRIFDAFMFSFSSLGLSPSSQYSFCRFDESGKPRLVSAKKTTR
jgi:hypothetical protein